MLAWQAFDAYKSDPWPHTESSSVLQSVSAAGSLWLSVVLTILRRKRSISPNYVLSALMFVFFGLVVSSLFRRR